MGNLLIVEDDSLFARLLHENFVERGYSCQIASDLDQARSLLLDCRVPSHCILDLNLPGGSGLTLIKELLAKNENMKIVVLTGFANIQTAVEAIKLGALYYLSKPVDSEQIAEAFLRQSGDSGIPIEREIKPLDSLERDHVLSVLAKNRFNISRAAEELGLHRRTLQRKMLKWGISKKEG